MLRLGGCTVLSAWEKMLWDSSHLPDVVQGSHSTPKNSLRGI